MLKISDFYGQLPTPEEPTEQRSADMQWVENQPTQKHATSGPHLPWLGMLILLVALRLVYEIAERVD